MPFTLAHPAAVMPLMRRPLVGAALVCGSIAPDIPYYVRATPLEVTAQSWYEPFTNATTSHSLAGLIGVALPLGLVVYLMVLAAGPPLRWLLRGRGGVDGAGSCDTVSDDPAASSRGLERWAWVPVSLLIGTLTHLAWDSVTSSDGVLAERLDVLERTVIADLTWIRLMQHASTVIGLAVIVGALWRYRRVFTDSPADGRRRTLRAFLGFAATGTVAAVVSVSATFDPSTSLSTRDSVESILAAASLGGGAAVALAGGMTTAWWWIARSRDSRGTG